MKKTNLEKLNDIFNRAIGGIPGRAARPDQRVADDKDIADLPRNILNHEVPWYGYDGKAQPKGKRTTTSLAALLGWLDSGIHNLMSGINNANQGIAGLTAAVKALSEKQGINPEDMARLIDKAVAEAVGTYELRRVDETPEA